MGSAGESDSFRLGIDVGGTFTDAVVLGAATAVRAKVPSTPHDPAVGVLDAVDAVARELGLDRPGFLACLERFGLGTTVVTNMLATHSGRRLGLVTTKGFEDLVPLARGRRISDGGWLLPPPSLVDRSCIVGVHERVDREGTVCTPLDLLDVIAAAERLVEREAVDTIVVSFLWSFRNPVHEHAARAAILERHSNQRVVCGADLAPVIREYDRTQFALLNAYVGSSLDWLVRLGEQLAADGLRPPVVLTHSGGGVTTVASARATPVGLAQSGPAAGGAAALALAASRGDTDVVTCDLGGTSLDVALVEQGVLLRRTRGLVMGHWSALSMVDVDSVGSGGGSIAWVDPVGAIRVGPQSAGAEPGPACYGRGGEQATVTDALVVLGYLDPTTFLGGRMPLDVAAAFTACDRLGAPVGLDAHEAAWGVREVALAAMARAVRGRIASRGLVASDLTLYAYGGCGGLFAADIAADVGARCTVVPDAASVFSAHGAATAPLRRERARSVAVRIPADAGALPAVLAELDAEVRADLAADGVAPPSRASEATQVHGACTVQLEADVRFERQGAEITVPVARRADGTPDVASLADDFCAEYARRFGAGAMAMGVVIEAMTLRAVGTDESDASAAPPATTTSVPSTPSTSASTRGVHLRRGEAAQPVTVVDPVALLAGGRLRGPAVVDAGDTTIWVPAGHTAVMDATGSLVISAEA